MEQMSRSARHLLHFSGCGAGIVVGRSPVSADVSPRRSDPGTSGSNRQLVTGRSVVRIVAALFMMLGCLGSASAVAPSSLVEPSPAMAIDEVPAALPAAESSVRRSVVRRRRLRRALNPVRMRGGFARRMSWTLPMRRHLVPPVWRGPPVLRV